MKKILLFIFTLFLLMSCSFIETNPFALINESNSYYVETSMKPDSNKYSDRMNYKIWTEGNIEYQESYYYSYNSLVETTKTYTLYGEDYNTIYTYDFSNMMWKKTTKNKTSGGGSGLFDESKYEKQGNRYYLKPYASTGTYTYSEIYYDNGKVIMNAKAIINNEGDYMNIYSVHSQFNEKFNLELPTKYY